MIVRCTYCQGKFESKEALKAHNPGVMACKDSLGPITDDREVTMTYGELRELTRLIQERNEVKRVEGHADFGTPTVSADIGGEQVEIPAQIVSQYMGQRRMALDDKIRLFGVEPQTFWRNER
jgi:hypothetical protein